MDHFGNAISCISGAGLAALGDPGRLRVAAGSVAVDGIVQTYADVEPGVAAALVGSGGLLELIVRDGSAAAHLGLQRGDAVSVERRR